MKRVYLDNSATTPMAPEVVESMLPWMTQGFGNASSIHHFGQEARAAVDKARHQVAALLNSRPNEVVFTSGGTESNNLAVRGLAEANERHGRHIITSQIEHPAVKNVCEDLEKRGFEVTYLPVYDDGLIRIDDVRSAIRPDTILVTVMWANNEIGTLQPVEEIGGMIKEIRASGRKIWFHTDAVQAAGKVPLDVDQAGCDLLSTSAHKINGPKGVGALYVRRGVRLHHQNIGGRQERGLRGGTEAVHNVVGMGSAAEIADEGQPAFAKNVAALRDRFERTILENIDGSALNGSPEKRVPNISNISFSGIEGEGLLIHLDMQGIAVSTGSACSSGSLEPSPVIRALGREDQLARGAIRFSFGRYNTEAELEYVLEKLPASVLALRSLNAARPAARTLAK